MRVRTRVAALALSAAASLTVLGAAGAAHAATTTPAAHASIMPNPGAISPEFDNTLRVTTHGTGNQLTVQGNGTQTAFYTTDATGGGQKFHVNNSSNCWELDGTAINAQPCAQGNGAQVFTLTGGSGIDNWFIIAANGQKVIIFVDASGRPLWTSANPPRGSLARWLF